MASDTQLSCSRAHSHTQHRYCPSHCLHRNSFSLSLANSVLQTFPELMRVFLAVTLASQAAGNALNWGPDRAKVSRPRLLRFGVELNLIFASLLQCTVGPCFPSLVPLHLQADRGTRSIFSLVDRTPLVDAASPAGDKPSAPARGALEFRDVTFRYPTRPDGPPALNKLNLVVRPGQKVALVGAWI